MDLENMSIIEYGSTTSSYHFTGPGPGPTTSLDSQQSLTGVTLIAITAVLSIVCNILNLIILPHLAELNEASRVFYMSLAVVDLATGILLLPMSVAAVGGEWPFGNPLCKALGYFLTVTTGLSSSTVFYLNVDRFIAVTRPLRYASLVNRKRAIATMVSQTFGTFIILFFVLYFAGDRFNIIVYREFGVCLVDFSQPYFAPYTIFSFAISMWMYAILLLIFYVLMLHIVRRHARTIASQAAVAMVNASTVRSESQTRTTEQFQKDVERAEKLARHMRHRGLMKSVILTVSIAGAFYIAWLPFTICEVVAAVRGKRIPLNIMELVSKLTLCNGWLNTVIYLLLKATYRHAVAEFVRKTWKGLWNHRRADVF
nr:beta-3 adrenergic receptor-like [Lytechinus pictus]